MTTSSARARLVPHLADYDRLGTPIAWRPYLMFFHHRNFTSPSVNTDRHGFRPTWDAREQRVTLDDAAGRDVNLLVGNSVSFGVGATSDQAALSSRLSAHSRELWLNFSGRAFGSRQELTLFETHRYKLGNVRRVVLFSGLNDLYLYYSPKTFDETFGIFFFSELFHKSLQSPPQAGLKTALATLVREIRARLRRKAADPAEDFSAVVSERLDGRQQIIEHIGRVLEIWSLLARGLGFELSYMVQPILPWTGKIHSAEEKELLAEGNAIGGRWNQILEMVLDGGHHRWFTDAMAHLCRRLDIHFYDLNADFPKTDDWLFLDRVHLTDAGQDVAARAVLRHLPPLAPDVRP